MAEASPARLLDLSRLVSRAGRVLTGIDRVELAYLRALLAGPVPVYGLVRTSFGFILIDRSGCRGVLDRLTGITAWGDVDRLSRLRPRGPLLRQQAESDLRRLAMARCIPLGLRAMLFRNLPQRSAYVNVGHSNLSDRVLKAVRRALNGRIAIMIHDTIPLDFPQYQKDGATDRFRERLACTRRHATLILCNSAQTQADVTRHMAAWGQVPDTCVLPLGVDRFSPDKDVTYPTGFDVNRPYFITIGTIEPRKNHSLLLKLWQQMQTELPPQTMPQLVICGARGWNNEAVFAWLDSNPDGGRHVFEMPGLTDGQIAALALNAQAALFPSHAEGFGLPPAEMLALGVPVICNTLEIYRETLGDYPVYASVGDEYLWRQEIQKLTPRPRDGQVKRGFKPPNWQDHFNGVLSRV